MSEHEVHENVRDNENLRSKFYDFVQTIFPSADFKVWFEKGFWLNNYKPFAIVMDDKIVSNVSITRMNLFVDGRERSGVQFGTVGTIPEYRGKGLSKYLMDYVLNRVKDSVDLLFLYANEDVLDFYPKFGFDRYSEVIFKCRSYIPEANYSARKLDINSQADFKIIRRLVDERLVISRLFGANDYGFITLWHILNIFPDNILYLEDDDIILIISERDGHLRVWDIIYSKPIDVDSAISKVIRENTVKSISYYFSPDQLNFKYDSVEEDIDSPLFVRGPFPIGKGEFKFPTTAQT
jgi:GNAT superfamily N-acetyltransferase